MIVTKGRAHDFKGGREKMPAALHHAALLPVLLFSLSCQLLLPITSVVSHLPALFTILEDNTVFFSCSPLYKNER